MIDFIYILSYTVPSFNFVYLNSATEVVRNDKISVTCSVQVSQITSSIPQLVQSMHVHSSDNQFPVILSSSTVSFIVYAYPEILPSYGCDIDFKFSGNFPTGYAINVPQNISLMTQARQVLCKYFSLRFSLNSVKFRQKVFAFCIMSSSDTFATPSH